jgi:hypothetical protein
LSTCFDFYSKTEESSKNELPVGYLTKLVRLIHAGNKRPGLIVVLAAYFDDSGRANTHPRLAVVGGYVGKYEQVEKLQENWAFIFKRDGVNSFHMTDYESNQGEYKGWGDNEETRSKKKRHMESLLSILNLYALQYIAFGVMLDEFEDVIREQVSSKDRQKIGGAHAFCFQSCLVELYTWIQSSSYASECVDVFYEEGTKVGSQLVNLYGAAGTISKLRDKFKFYH